MNLGPQRVRDIVSRITRAVGAVETPAAIVTSSASRFFLRQMLEGSILNLAALSHNEIPAGVRVVSIGLIQ
jgi:flagellar biosynthesis component FlhA